MIFKRQRVNLPCDRGNVIECICDYKGSGMQKGIFSAGWGSKYSKEKSREENIYYELRRGFGLEWLSLTTFRIDQPQVATFKDLHFPDDKEKDFCFCTAQFSAEDLQSEHAVERVVDDFAGKLRIPGINEKACQEHRRICEGDWRSLWTFNLLDAAPR